MKKAFLTIQDINNNLNKYFPGKGGYCTGFWQDEYVSNGNLNYHIRFVGATYKHDLIVTSKKVILIAANKTKQNDYLKVCNNWSNRISALHHFGNHTYIPFIYDKKSATDEHKKQYNDLLICVGYAKDKSEMPLTDLQRLQAFKIPIYVQVYKLMQELQDMSGKLEREKIYAGYGKYTDGQERLVVTHKTGSFKIPIELIDNSTETTKQIRAIFFNALNMPLDNEIQPELSKVMYITGKGTLKAKKAICRLHKIAA